MGMEQASAAEAYPALRFFDLLSWQRQSKPDAKWHGYHALAQKVCPVHAKWIKAACSEVTTDAHKVFRLFAAWNARVTQTAWFRQGSWLMESCRPDRYPLRVSFSPAL